MKKYKVLLYFGMHVVNPFIAPRVIEVEVDEDIAFNENEIILKALRQLVSYPRTYTAIVEEIK